MDPAQTSTTAQAGQAEQQKTETPQYMTKAEFEAWASAREAKINGEFASLRKKTAKSDQKTGDEGAAAPATPAAATLDDLAAMRELGRLESKFSEEELAELAEDEGWDKLPIKEQVRALRLALRFKGKAGKGDEDKSDSGETPTKPSRGETPERTRAPARGSPSAQRSSVGVPGSYAEWKALPIADKRKVLDHHPSFDPDLLLARERRGR